MSREILRTKPNNFKFQNGSMTMFARYFPLVGGIIKPAEETQKQYARYSIHFVKQFIKCIIFYTSAQ